MLDATTIRFARVAEREALEALQRRASLAGPLYREQLAATPDVIELPAEQIAAGLVRVAEQDGVTAGFAVLLERDGDSCELDGLFVEPDRMRGGVGRMLVEDAKRIARERDARRIVVIANPQADAFYRAVGFLPAGEAPPVDGRWEFAPAPGGGTRLTLTPLAHLSGPARVADGAVEQVTALVFRRFHRRLKRALEQGDGTTTAGRASMTAIVQDEYGPAPEDVLRVEEIDRPVAAEDQVLVRVHAASVDRGTWHVMAGLAVSHPRRGLRAPEAQVPQPRPEPGGNGRGGRRRRDRLHPGRRRLRHRRGDLREYALARPD